MKRAHLALITVAVAAVVLLPTAYNILQAGGKDGGNGYVTITDSAGRTVNVPESPTRIAVVNTYTAEVLRALGVDPSIIVGISEDFADEALWSDMAGKRVVQTSAHGEPDVEAMLDMKIQVLFTFGTHQFVNIKTLESSLAPAGIAVVGLDFFRYGTLYSDIATMGKIFNKEERAAELIEGMREVEQTIETRIGTVPESERPTVVIEHHSSSAREPVVQSSTSQWGQLVELAGGVNIFGDLIGTTARVDPVDILRANPDYYFLDGMAVDIGYGRSNVGQYEAAISALGNRDGFSDIQAVTEEHVYIFAGEFAGPMMIYGAGVIASILYPDLFDDVGADWFITTYFSTFHGVEVQGVMYYPES
ncbi:ABC transporter substrate-binding protein [Methanomassiliicoccus luminyensis]|uniref:ABC transporter substrate-binding protein n=1 Tax=Methanomassiliicoccus luminyensis TaxID=1080712 RepID=UPI0009DA0F6F|nr:ABC transporter substrate-binding protein [Methanomassiliicoccus luminyensis]